MVQKKNIEIASATSISPSNQPLAATAPTTTVQAPEEVIPGQSAYIDPNLALPSPSDTGISASVPSTSVSPAQKVSQKILNQTVRNSLSKPTFQYGDPVLTDKFFANLEKHGYSKEQLESAKIANADILPQVEPENNPDYAENMAETQDVDFNAETGQIEKSAASKVMDYPGSVVYNTLANSAQGIQQGLGQMLKASTDMGLAPKVAVENGEIKAKYADIKDLPNATLNMVAGGIKTAFGVGGILLPELAAFNLATEAIHELPDEAKASVMFDIPGEYKSNEEKAKSFDTAIDFPFAAASTIAEMSGRNPEEGSSEKAIYEILNILIPIGAHRAPGKFKDVIKNIDDLKSISDRINNGTATPEEITTLVETSNGMKDITISEVKDALAEKGLKDQLGNYLKIPNEEIVRLTSEGETAQTIRQQAESINEAIKTELDQTKVQEATMEIDNLNAIADALEMHDRVADNPREFIDAINADESIPAEEKAIAIEQITNSAQLDFAQKNVENAKVQHITDMEAIKDPGSAEFYHLAEEALSDQSVLKRVKESIDSAVKSGEITPDEGLAQFEALQERVSVQEKINPALKDHPEIAMKAIPLIEELKGKEEDLKKTKSFIPPEPEITIQNKERGIENTKEKLNQLKTEANEKTKETQKAGEETDVLETEPPEKPPVEKGASPVGETPEEKVHAIWKRVLSEMKDTDLAAGIEKEGVTYLVKKDAISESSARDIVSAAKQSGKMAELEKVVLDDSNGMDPVTRGVTSAMIGKDYFDMSEAEIDPIKKADHLKEFFKYTDKAASLATEGGQMGNAIGKVIKKMYASNPETVVAKVNEFLRKNNEEILAGKEDQIRDTYSSIKEILSSEEGQKAITEEIEKRATKIFGKETQQKISDLFDKAKIDTTGTLQSSIIPPQLINTAIEVMKQTALLGAKGLEIIEQGVLHIKENYKEEWDEAAFRKDWEKKLKDSGVEFGEKEKKVKEVKSELEKAQAKLAKLEEAIKDPQKYLDELESKRKELAESENVKPEELKNIEAQIKEKKAILKDLVAEIKGEKTLIEKKQQTLDDLEYYIDNPAEYVKKLEEKRKTAQEREDAKPEEIKEIEEKISSARKELKRKVTPKQEKSILDIIEKKAGRLKPENRAKFLKDIVQEVEKEGGLDEQRFKDLYAQALGLETMTPELIETIKGYSKIINEGTEAEKAYLKSLDDIIDAQNEGAENSVIKDLQQKKSIAAQDMVAASMKAKKANAALSELMKDNKKLSDTLIGMMQLGALTPGSIIKNITAMPAELAFRAVSGHVQGAADYLLTELANVGYAPESWKNRTVNSVARSQGTWYAHPKAMKKMYDTILHGSFAEDFTNREVHNKIEPVQAFKNLVSGKSKGDLSAMAANFVEALPQGYLAAGMGRALAGPDAFFRTIGEQAKAYELGTMKGLEGAELEKYMFEPPKEDLEKIQRAGDEITFQQDSKVSEMIKGGLASAKRFSEKMEGTDKNRISKAMTGALRVIGKSQALYVKTPINVFGSVVRMVSPEYSALKAIGALSKGDKENFSKYMADVAVGYALRYTIVNAIKHGMVTPTVDYKSKEGAAQTDLDIKHGGKFNRSAYMRMLTGGDWHEQPDDIWVDYSKWTGGLGIAVGAYASMLDGVSKEEMDQMTMAKNSYKVLPTMMQQVLDLSFMSSTAMAIDAMRESDGASKKQKWFVSTVGTLATPLVPNTATTIVKATSDTKKEVRSKDWIENLKNEFSYKLTGGSELPSKVTLWGDKVATAPKEYSDTKLNQIMYYLFDVPKPENPDENSIGYKIMELARRTGDKRIVPAAPSNQITINKEKVVLDGSQFEQLQINIGVLRKKMVKEYFDEEAYKSDDDAQKAYKLEKIYNEAHKMGTEMLINSDEHLTGIKNNTSNTTPVTGHRKPRPFKKRGS